MAAENQVVLYAKPGCCLCDRVREQLRSLQRASSFQWQEVNIEQDREAFARFKEEIPVVFINGQKVFKHRLDEKIFFDLLSRAGGAGAQTKGHTA